MGRKGFTVIGVVLVLCAVSVPAVLLGPLLFREVTVSKEEQTRRKLDRLVAVIAGIPEEETFGFIGDLGRLPQSLEELNSLSDPPTLCDSAFNPAAPPTFHTTDGTTPHMGQVGMGWRGPYFREMVFSDEHLRDAWGQKLRYTCPETTRPATDPTTAGVALTLRTGQITSAGADGIFDSADDIESEPFHDRGHLFLTITQGAQDAIARAVTVHLFFPVNGEQTSLVSEPQTVAAPEGSEITVVFASIPAGVRYAKILYSVNRFELYHVGVKSNIANRIKFRIPVGPGKKPS